MPDARYHLSAAHAHHRAGCLPAAEAAYGAGLALAPNSVECVCGLAAVIAADNARLAEAEALLRAAAERMPASAVIRGKLAAVMGVRGRMDEAAAMLREVTALMPGDAMCWNNLAAALEVLAAREMTGGEGDGATGRKSNLEEAVDAYREAVAIRPGYFTAHNNRGNALRSLGRLTEAEAAHREAIRLSPTYWRAWNNLAATLSARGEMSRSGDPLGSRDGSATPSAENALDCYRELVRLRPTDAATGSDLLLAMHYVDGISPEEMFAAHIEWAARCATSDAETTGPDAGSGMRNLSPRHRSKAQRIRVGYVSPDFREHPVSRFVGGILQNHDREQFEIFCYSDAQRPDAVTESLRNMGHTWRDTAGLSDERLAERIWQDAIDILVDLAGHTANNRLPTFARKPAPVQVTYHGYPDTTGLKTIEYRLTDAMHDPRLRRDQVNSESVDQETDVGFPGEAAVVALSPPFRVTPARSGIGSPFPDHSEPDLLRSSPPDAFYTERLARLPRLCVAYNPGTDLPGVGPLPALARGYAMFAVMNRLVKVTPPMMRVWAQILSAVPGSRLTVMAGAAADDPGLRQRFVNHGVDSDRLRLLSSEPRWGYLERFSESDIALDTFPYAGITTTCDGLWMGVPTVTLAGETHVARTGVSILTAVGLPELVATTAEEYVAIATDLARDLPRLAEIRTGLRACAQRSPLGDSLGLTRAIESVYRTMVAEVGGGSEDRDKGERR